MMMMVAIASNFHSFNFHPKEEPVFYSSPKHEIDQKMKEKTIRPDNNNNDEAAATSNIPTTTNTYY
jgi:hypothetical protein